MPNELNRRRSVKFSISRMWRDQQGFTLVFFAVALPMLLGIVGLVVDLGQLYALDSQLASSADTAAVAAASKLDRSDGAIDSARGAAQAVVDRAWISGSRTADLSFRFAATLNDLRSSPTFTLASSDGAQAAYVEVTSERRSMTASFLQFVGARPVNIQRRAIAMSQYYACDVTPLLLCQRDPERFKIGATKGRQYRLRHMTGRADGTLLAFDLPGDDAGLNTARELASDRPAFCYSNSLRMRPNVAIPQFDDAMNVRFDRYANATGAIAPSLAVFPPAPNVIKGQRYNSCFSPPGSGDFNPPYHLPRDSAFRTSSVAFAYNAGTGDWKSTAAYGGSGSSARTALEEYIFWNHTDKTPIFRGGLLSSSSRYEIYLRELGLDETRDATPVSTFMGSLDNTLPTGGPRTGPYRLASEIATPRCYRGQRAVNDARRRVIYAAVADCVEIERSGSDASVRTLSMTVAKFFLTEPVRSGLVLVEFQKFLRPASDDGKLRHIVQLVAAE